MPWASDDDEPQALLGELRASGVGAEGVEMDLSLPDSARRLLDTAGERLGGPSILVNTAAYSARDGFEALAETILDLARAVETLSSYIEEPEHPVETRGFALEAAGGATAVLEERNDLRTSMLVGQVRSTAVDLLRAAGMDSTEAHEALRQRANRTSHEPTTQTAWE
jgi:hypothetical protein